MIHAEGFKHVPSIEVVKYTWTKQSQSCNKYTTYGVPNEGIVVATPLEMSGAAQGVPVHFLPLLVRNLRPLQK